jgi:hypothetical protein
LTAAEMDEAEVTSSLNRPSVGCGLWVAGLEVLNAGLAFGDIAGAHDNVIKCQGCC